MPRHVTGVIDHHVPRAIAQDLEFAVAIADEGFKLRKQLRVALTSIEQSEGVSASLQGFNEVRPDETRATQYEHTQRFRSSTHRHCRKRKRDGR